ncbi:hypothetical protein [Rhodoferax antarcticus]|uniref:Uncharacterized protein n=1 Tax=Rhodoferax antarcticus ANT.BR TaxID=1111071 RepID=A0A1Q8Y8X9_9BURK|nr:hypothetical protein [Rhodoferax antarcticus]OLP04453.1 hypothetical protein BLL52_4308 [Rhodoferax antarcticus ANT.BR]
MTKEDIYDNEISPLMAQVIEICKKKGIAMIANFACPNDTDEDLQALSIVPDENGKHPANHTGALYSIRPSSRPSLMMTTTRADGGKTITAFL